jgi:hypothetical protein
MLSSEAKPERPARRIPSISRILVTTILATCMATLGACSWHHAIALEPVQVGPGWTWITLKEPIVSSLRQKFLNIDLQKDHVYVGKAADPRRTHKLRSEDGTQVQFQAELRTADGTIVPLGTAGTSCIPGAPPRPCGISFYTSGPRSGYHLSIVEVGIFASHATSAARIWWGEASGH